MNNNNAKTIKPIDITVDSGKSVIITIPPYRLTNGCHYNLFFCLTEIDISKYNHLIQGTEVVFIKNGVSGKKYILEDNKANTFYADLLKLNYCYRLRYGNNAPKNEEGVGEGFGHFLNLNTPVCARAYDPANKTSKEYYLKEEALTE